jgi:hypothetical protein
MGDNSFFGPVGIFEGLADSHRFLNLGRIITKLLFFVGRAYEPILFFKLSAIFLHIISVFFIYGVGRMSLDKKAGFIMAFVFALYSLSMNSFFGGLSRDVGFTLICMFLYFFLKEKNIICSLLGLMALLFYPYNVIIIAAALLLGILNDRGSRLAISDRILLSALFLLPALLFVYAAFGGINLIDLLRQNFSLDYKNYFRVTVSWTARPVLNFVLHVLLNIQEHHDLYKYFTLFLLIFNGFFIIVLGKKSFELPRKIGLFALAVFLSFFLFLVFFSASVASRALIFSLPVILVVFFTLSLVKIFDRFKINLSGKTLVSLLLPLALLFIIFFKPSLFDLTCLKSTFNFLKTLPEDALIAGHPNSVEFVPLYSERKILCFPRIGERIPMDERFRRKFKEVELDLLEALYANSTAPLKKLVVQYGVTHVMIDYFYYSADFLDNVNQYSEYANRRLIAKIINRENKERKFAVLDYAKNNSIFKYQNILIFDCKKLLNTEKGPE